VELSYQRDDVCERAEQNGQSASELDMFNSDLGDHRATELDVAVAVPVNIEIQLDAAVLGFVDIDVSDLQRRVAQVNLVEMKRVQRRREHGPEHGLGDLLDDGSPSNADVGP